MIEQTQFIARNVPDLIYNGGMEDGNPPTYWSMWGSPPTFERSNAQKHSGDYSTHIIADGSNQGFSASQNRHNQSAGIIYKQSVWFYMVSGQIQSRWNTGGGAGADIFTHTTTGSWQYWSRWYEEIDGGDEAYPAFYSNGGAAEFYIDDVSVWRC
jgi:hypothetical protein